MIRYRQVALEDLGEVVTYSRASFTTEVAEAYLEDLLAGVQMVERFPYLGPAVAERPGVHRLRRGRHFIYYEVDGEDLVVLAIVHERQLPPSHLFE